jgi:hypothetical protein
MLLPLAAAAETPRVGQTGQSASENLLCRVTSHQPLSLSATVLDQRPDIGGRIVDRSITTQKIHSHSREAGLKNTESAVLFVDEVFRNSRCAN